MKPTFLADRVEMIGYDNQVMTKLVHLLHLAEPHETVMPI